MPDARGTSGARPLLSICIPTFNRAPFLAELLQALLPQLTPARADVELVISDNASTDTTATVIADFRARGLPLRLSRNQENLGADENFLRCHALARGRYLWLLGDDDLPMPNAIPQLLSLLKQGEAAGGYDLVYLSSFGFAGSLPAAPSDAMLQDRLGRFAEIVTDGEYLLEKVNALIGLISVVLINRDRLLTTPHPPLDNLRNTNLMQVGWIFPLLHARCRVLFVWQRLLGYRHFNSGGWGICEVFGVRLDHLARRYFSAEPALARALMNGVLRYWMPDSIMLARRGHEQAMDREDILATLRPVFANNWRFWLCVVPVARLPLPLARAAHAILRTINRATRISQALLRHRLRPGKPQSPKTLNASGETPRELAASTSSARSL